MPTDPHGLVWIHPDAFQGMDGAAHPAAADEPTPQRPGASLYCAGEPQGQWLSEMAESDVRLSFLQIAATSAGMCADERQGRDRTGYSVLLSPGESDQMSRDMRRMHGCALAVRGWLRLAGVLHRRLAAPYVTSAAFDDVYEIGCGFGRVTGGRLAPDRYGTIVSMDRANPHMAVFSHVDAHHYAWTVDGGQVASNGQQAIVWRQRKAHFEAGHIVRLDDRDVIWTLDPSTLGRVLDLQWRLPWRFGSPVAPPKWMLPSRPLTPAGTAEALHRLHR